MSYLKVSTKEDSSFDNYFLMVVLCLCLLKLFLVGTNEIISIPNDSVNYLRQSTDAIRDLGSPPGYPLWLALSAGFGLPQRVAIEILYLIGSVSLAFFLVKPIGRVFVLILLGCLIFLPATFFLFDNALSDGFFTCLTLLALALSVGVLIDQDPSKMYFWLRLILLSLILGWMLITRSEDYLVVGWILWLIVCRSIFLWKRKQFRQLFVESMSCTTLLIVVSFSVVGVISSYHFVTKGVFVRTISSLPSHTELMHNLASIDSGLTINRVPITKAQREVGYSVSPILARLSDHIENPNNMYQVASAKSGLPLGEIGAGWVWHVFNDAAFQLEPHMSLRELNEFYIAANSEMKSGFDNGVILKKFVPHPLLAGNTKGLLANLLGSLATVYTSLFKPTANQPSAEFKPNLFDTACLRRTAIVDSFNFSGVVQGWAYVNNAKVSITKVDVGVYQKSQGLVDAVWLSTEELTRPDVIKAFMAEGHSLPEVFGFRVILPRVKGDDAVVRYFFSDGSYFLTPPLISNKVSQIKPESPNISFEVVQGIDSTGEVLRTPTHNNVRHKIQKWIIRAFVRFSQHIAICVLILTVASVIFAKKYNARFENRNLSLFIAIFIGGVFSQRVIFYTLVDAIGWSVGDEPRYLVSALIMLIVSIVALAVYAFHSINGCLGLLSKRG